MNNPFWLYEVRIDSIPRGAVVFTVSKHLRRSKAKQQAQALAKLMSEHPESNVLTPGVHYRFER